MDHPPNIDGNYGRMLSFEWCLPIPTIIHWGKANHFSHFLLAGFTHLPQFFTTAAQSLAVGPVGPLGPLVAFAPALALGHPEVAMNVEAPTLNVLGTEPMSGNF